MGTTRICTFLACNLIYQIYTQKESNILSLIFLFNVSYNTETYVYENTTFINNVLLSKHQNGMQTL